MRRNKLVLWLMGVVLIVAAAATVALQQRFQETNSADASLTASEDARESRTTETPAVRRVFRSPLAGTWYDADSDRLSAEIGTYLDNAPDKKLADLCALILPHAGYRWSGQTAAYGIKQLAGRKFRRVIVMGPTHRVPMENIASVPDATHYATPLGELALDRDFLARLKKYDLFQTVPRAHDGEHSVQIEVPLLQHTLGQCPLVPIVVGQLDRSTVRRLAEILRGLMDEQTLVVVSSDFTHFGDNFGYTPFSDDVAANLKKLDMDSMTQIRNKSVDGFFDHVDKTGTTICGRYAMGVLLAMLPAGSEAHLLHYDTSGRMSDDYSNSVSYLSVAFTGKWPKGSPVQVPSDRTALSDDDKQRLLRLARSTLAYALDHRTLPTAEQLDIEITPAMKGIFGAFVTLHKKGQLRGCIGEIVPTRPLYRAVMAQAVNAGLNDRRFSPVRAAELPELEFEISALTPPKPVASAQDIVIGKHGMVLKKDGRSAVFLPQVAVEQGWDLDQTLTHLSRKAGLPEDAWKSGASFTVFEAIVFGEGHE